jgi:prepilin-type N-terminal cleavage/methylation domain-containing protein
VIGMGKSARSEAGMSLVELLIAMVVMSIGIAAIVAGFSGGIFTAERAANASSAGALADQQMEGLRGLAWSSIATGTTPMDGTYSGDSAFPPGVAPGVTAPITTASPCATYCQTTRGPVSASGGSYRIDTYVAWKCIVSGSALGGTLSAPTCSTPSSGPSAGVASRAVKFVTVVVRDWTTQSKVRFRESSSFDQTTG